MQKWIKDLSKWAEYFREDWNQVNPVDESELRKKIKLLEEHSSQKVLQIEKLGSKLSLEEDAYQNTLNKLHEENERLETSFNERVQQKEKQKQEYEKEIERLRQLTSYLVESIHEIEFLGFKRDYFIQQNQKLSTAVEPLVGLISSEKFEEILTQQQLEFEEVRKANLELRQNYFFSFALEIKLTHRISNLNLNDLYNKIVENNIPQDQWESWILLNCEQDRKF
eukprot:TRINITY_DN837_c0_g1_i2.p1 TRINITY_DN837_c0_g1~~TRINITY_DN837_c0_g1_i2.p1  ORF type:complete len:224 (+),score=48.08 TRINITY_DN837_c0_g1_i2:396-1067(+)